MHMKTFNVLRKKAEKSKTQGMIIRDIPAATGINEKHPESTKQLITLDEIGISLSENDRSSSILREYLVYKAKASWEKDNIKRRRKK